MAQVISQVRSLATAGAEQFAEPSQKGGGRFSQMVMNPRSLTPPLDQAQESQGSDMPGDRALGQAQNIDQIADADFGSPVSQQVKQPQPGWIGQRFEKDDELL